MAVRRYCIDGKKCKLGLSCEYAQVRDESCEVVSLFEENPNPTPGECMFWKARRELASEQDVIRKTSPQLERAVGQARRKNRLTRSNPNLILPQPPDPMTARHIKDGRNIKGDD